MVNVMIIAELVAICAIFLAMVLLLADGTGAKEQKLMVYFLCGALVQNAGYLLELLAPGMEAALQAVKMQYLGSVFLPLCYCCFIYSYCYEKPPLLLRLVPAADLGVLAAVYAQDWHNLYYREVEWLATGDGHHFLNISYGPLYPVFVVCSCLIPHFLSIYILVRAIIARPEQARSRKYGVIVVLSVLPILSLLAYALKFTYVFDLTPAMLGVVLSLVVIMIWRRQTYDFERMASEVLLDSMGDGVVVLDTQRRILGYNKAAAEIFPELESHKVGDSIEDIGDFPEDAVGEDALSGFQLNDRYYESHGEQILDREKRNLGYVVLILDVTDTRNYIEEIKRVREQAEQANIAKSEFLANMSHEIRTPMNAIVGLSELIMEESMGRKLYNNAKDIKSASQNLLAIINDILDLSKVEAGKMELVKANYYVKPMVDEVVNMMDIAASQRGLVMKYEWDDGIPCGYYGDAGRIKQILINLLNNAVKFTKEGHVKVVLGGKPGEKEDEEVLSFRVEDTGCGIREEDQKLIFENFKQVNSRQNRSVEGTGLGLSITKQLVNLMGGQIGLQSIYGVGSVFTVTIPQTIVDRRTVAETPDMPEEKEGKAEAFISPGTKVLVVDDNLINRKVAKGLLGTYQLDMEEAENGFAAIELVKQKKYDIIFMDHMMPEMDGIETVRIIRTECGANGTAPVIIALTANAMEGVRERFLNNGFQDFLSKPMDRQHLNECLLRWIPEERRGSRAGSVPGEDEEGYDLELVRLYCLDGERKTALLRELYDKKDYKNYEIEVHALKSASASVGVMKLSAAAKEHEEAAGRGDTEYIEAHFEELMAAYERQLGYFRSFLEREQAAEPARDLLPGMDRGSLAEKLREALGLLENFRSRECAEVIDGLLGHELEPETAGKLRDIREQLRLYEDENAEQMLAQILEWLDREERG